MAEAEQVYTPQVGAGGTAPFGGASPDAFGAGVGAQLERAGAGLENAQMAARRLELERQKAAEASDIGLKFAQLKASLPEQLQKFRDAAPGDGNGHVAAVDDWLGKQTSTILDGAKNRENLQQFATFGENLRASVVGEETGWAHGQRVEFLSNNVRDVGNQLANSEEIAPSTNYLDSMSLVAMTIGGLGLDANTATSLTREMQREVANAHVRGVTQQDPQAGKALIESGELNDYLKPEDIAHRREEAIVFIHRQEEAAKAAAAHNLALFKASGRTMIEDVGNGVQVDPAKLEGAIAQAEQLNEPDLVHDLRIAAAKNKVTVQFGPAGQAEREKALRGIEQTKDWQKDPALVAQHTQLATLMGRDQARSQSDKMGLWSQNGGHLTPFNVTDPASVKARVTEMRAATSRLGGPDQLLTEQEVAPLRQQFQTGKPNDKAALIETISGYGSQVAKTLLRQIAPLEPQYAVLADLATMRNHSAGRLLARDALNGWEELKADKNLIHGTMERQMQADIDMDYSNATIGLDPVTRQGVMEVARGIYARKLAEKGQGGTYDPNLWKKSYEAALGAAGDGTGGFAKARTGERYLLPRGMSAGDVDYAVSRATGPEIEAAGGHDAPLWGGRDMHAGEFKQNLTPVAVGDGIYWFRSPGGGYAASKAHPGANFTLDLRALARRVHDRR